MAKQKIKDVVSDLLNDYLDEKGLELWNVEFVKEVKDWFLRVYIDKKSHDKEEYISIEECEDVSRYLSEILDRDDPIEQNYYLEVSSPGMDRELITEAHYKRYIGSLVDMKLYKAIDGQKTLTATLDGIDDNNYYLKDEKDNILTIAKSQVAKTKLAVVF